MGRAARLARAILCERSHLYVGNEGAWRYWTGTHWEHDHARTIYRFAARLAEEWNGDCANRSDPAAVRNARARREKGLSRAAVSAAVELAISYPCVTCLLADLDAHPYLLNTAAGTVNLRTGAIARTTRATGSLSAPLRARPGDAVPGVGQVPRRSVRRRR